MMNAPAADEVEISLFGPSYGESIAIHATQGHWIVIDSCFVPGSKKSRPLQYLEQIGVDVAKSVRLIIATHWDDDHIGGLAECVRRCSSAKFVLSAAIASQEFVTIVRLADSSFLGKAKNVKEFSEILNILNGRHHRPILAIENTELWNDEQSTRYNPKPRLLALSPSSTTIMDGHLNIAELLRKIKKSPVRPISTSRNDRSIVVFLEAGNATALLGADLEEKGNANTGWSAILNSHIKVRKGQVFKVPHHGSEDAHHPEIWRSLLEPNPHTILAPWQNAGRSIPCSDDVKRLTEQTDRLYITAIPHNYSIQRSEEAQRLLEWSGVKLRQTDQLDGHICLRANARAGPPAWKETLLGGAKQISGKMYKAFPK